MAVSVLIRFPIPFERAIPVYEQRPELMQPIGELITKHGLISHETLVGDGEFIDIDTFPTFEAYQAFQEEAAVHIAAFEEALGVSSTDTVYKLLDLPPQE